MNFNFRSSHFQLLRLVMVKIHNSQIYHNCLTTNNAENVSQPTPSLRLYKKPLVVLICLVRLIFLFCTSMPELSSSNSLPAGAVRHCPLRLILPPCIDVPFSMRNAFQPSS